MRCIHADHCASVSELKKSPAKIMVACQESAVAILNRNTPEAYVVSADIYESMLEELEDYRLAAVARERLSEREQAVKVSLDDL